MSLQSLNLDDRTFEDLVAQAMKQVRLSCPDWTDLSPGDPGTVLLEAFAYLTEIMIYRLNRLPEKAFVEFVRLLNLKIETSYAASTLLTFTLAKERDQALEIPPGTRVAAERSGGSDEPPVFVTTQPLVIAAGQLSGEVTALHCELVEAELAGFASGLPGMSVQLKRAPVIADSGDGMDLVVGIEATEDELGGSVAAREYQDKIFRIWQEVEGFSDLDPQACVYVADRTAGLITFAPAIRSAGEDGLAPVPEALAAIPADGREIRVWYRRGGGTAGNVKANALTTIKDPLAGVHLEVTNANAATGGRAVETIENTLVRAPVELHSLQRAVTARDFELVAVKSSGGINRARAYTKATVWSHAKAGTTQIIMVPQIPDADSGSAITPELLQAQQNDQTLQRVQDAVDLRKPLGTICLTEWCRYKNVKVIVTVRVRREEDGAAVKNRILKRLNTSINPLSLAAGESGWPFGQSLSSYHIYKILGAEPGVEDVEPVILRVEHVPDTDVTSLSADAFQPDTWYVSAATKIFRSLNDAAGWEEIAEFDGNVDVVEAYPLEAGSGSHAGLVAAIAEAPDSKGGSILRVSFDCGEYWSTSVRTEFRINDCAWMERDDIPVLLLATEVGLYEIATGKNAVPVQILVDETDKDMGFLAVAVSTDVFGANSVALAARSRGGIYLSTKDGNPNTFEHIGLKNEMVHVLAVQHNGPHRFLWAGMEAVGNDPGKGAALWELGGGGATWKFFGTSWQAGGCQGLAFLGTRVLAASSRLGVLSLETEDDDAAWVSPDVECGLPLREFGEGDDTEIVMERVDCVAAHRASDTKSIVLAGGSEGVYRSSDGGSTFTLASKRDFPDTVTLPFNWLFCSVDHEVEVKVNAAS